MGLPSHRGRSLFGVSSDTYNIFITLTISLMYKKAHKNSGYQFNYIELSEYNFIL